jgi:DNA polymerase-3 subunit epsilon
MYTVIDVETTGLFPGRSDRIIEVGVVRLDDQLQVIDEWATLVDPSRDVGPTSIHGIAAQDLIGAPRWDEIVGDVLEALSGRVVVGHNVQFDLRFVESECRRVGIDIAKLPTLCTFRLLGGRLEACCADHGIDLGTAHSALDDARATARLLGALAADEPQLLPSLLPHAPRSVRFDGFPPTGRRHLRSDAAHRRVERETWLPRLVQSLPPATGIASDEATAAYMDVLDRVLEDRRIDEVEQDGIVALAEEWQIDQSQARDTHRRYLERLVVQAKSDGVVTSAEMEDIHAVGRLLGWTAAEVDSLLSEESLAAAENLEADSLHGLSVCFTGQLSMARAEAQQRAADAGLIVLGGVTKKLDILVLADPDSQSGKAKKARSYGTRLMSEAVFFEKIGH